MKRSVFLSLAASLLLAGFGHAATRPHYGGTLHIELRAPLTSLDPAEPQASSAAQSAQEHIASLIFDPLVRLDEKGAAQPALALTWQHTPDFKSWQFTLQSYIKFHDGTPFTAGKAVESLLKIANPQWRVHAEGNDSLVFESDSPLPNLPAELAQMRCAIAHGSGSAITGTGPFQVSAWQPGKQLVLKANDDYWDARPYLDSIEITLGSSLHDQMVDLELGRADLIEVGPDQARRAAQEGKRVLTSSPNEVFVLVFNLEKSVVQDERLRESIASALDRAAINNVLLQKEGEPSGALLPQWISGYAFLFPAARNLDHALQLRGEIMVPATLVLEYDFSDPLAKAVAERVAVNAREARINMQALGENLGARGAGADLQLMRVRFASLDASTALSNVATALLPVNAPPADAPKTGATNTAAGVYRAEADLLNGFRIVPIAQVPEAWGVSGRVKNWMQPRAGGWNLADVWLDVSQASGTHAEGRP
jgi:peptide/nickel transport system substrate-binding protein